VAEDAGPAAAARPGTAVKKPAAKPSGPTLKPGLQLKPGLKPVEDKGGATPRKQNLNASLGGKTASRSTLGLARPATAAAAQDDDEPFNVNPGDKERRALADSKSRWSHDEVNKLHIQQLQKLSDEMFGSAFSKLLWSSDFK